jgi:hypothetical protein
VQGKAVVKLDGEEHIPGNGDSLLMLRSVPHMFHNPFDEETRAVTVVSPPGLKNYYRELSELPPGPPDVPPGRRGDDPPRFGAEAMPPAGDDGVRDVRAVDTGDAESFASWFAEDATYILANNCLGEPHAHIELGAYGFFLSKVTTGSALRGRWHEPCGTCRGTGRVRTGYSRSTPFPPR